MPSSSSRRKALQTLRERAAALAPEIPADLQQMPADAVRRLVHDLQVHQIELQMQNEELREAQLELARSRDLFTDLYDFAPVGYLTLESDMKIVQANLRASILFGVERKSLEGQSLVRFVSPECRETLGAHQRAALGSLEKQICEIALLRSGGTPMPVELQTVRLDLDGSGQRGLRCIVIDISERKRAEEEIHRLNSNLEQQVVERTEALRRNEEAMNEFFEDAPIGLLWVEPDGRIVRVNEAQLEILEYSEQEVLGHRINRFDIGKDLAAVIPALARGEPVHNYRARMRLKGGAIAHVLVDATAIREDGRLVRTHWFVRDITERTELEREMLEVGERERQQVGRELHDDLGQMLHGVHFLAADLQARMKEKGLPEARDLERVTRFIDEALETTRSLSHGLQPVQPVPEGLANALREHAARIRKLYGVSCRFTCRKPIEVDDPNVATHLFRVAQEAINNAIKHAKCKRISISLRASNSRLNLGIRDDGHGRIPMGESRCGIGLHVMQFRATAVGGSLVVQRGPKGGTEVLCSLPFSDGQLSQPFPYEEL